MSEQQLNISCKVNPCPPDSDFTVYNLQDALYFNGTPISVLAECPPGYYCAPGTFPTVFTYPPGTFNVVIPPNRGFPIVLLIRGCEHNLNATLPSTATSTEIQVAANQMFQEAAQQQGRCDALKIVGPPLPIPISLSDIDPYTCANEPVIISISASSSPIRVPVTFTVSGKPSWLIQSQVGSTLVLTGTPTTIEVLNFMVIASAPGVPSASGSKAYTLNVVGISNSSPLPQGQTGVAYSTYLNAETIPGFVTLWEVTSGALPPGLSINQTTWNLEGTPTLDDTYDFTVRFTTEIASCSKAFSLEIVAASICGATPQNVQDLVWAKTNGMQFADPACVNSTLLGASGTWFVTKSVGGPCLAGFGPVGLSATLCNPGAAYLLTVTIPYASSGNILDIPPGGPYIVSFNLLFDNVVVSQVLGNIATDTPNPIVLSALLPAAISTLVTIYIAVSPLPAPPANFVTVASAGNLVITPPTHP